MPRPPRPSRAQAPAPVAHWDDDDSSAPDLIWWAQLDNRYLVEVVRPSRKKGAWLRIYDHTAGDRLVADHPAHLTDNAQFGPVIGDVVAWQRLAIEAVNRRRQPEQTSKENQGEEHDHEEAGQPAKDW